MSRFVMDPRFIAKRRAFFAEVSQCATYRKRQAKTIPDSGIFGGSLLGADGSLMVRRIPARSERCNEVGVGTAPLGLGRGLH